MGTTWSSGSSTPAVGQQSPTEVFSIGEVISTRNGVIGTIVSFPSANSIRFSATIPIEVAQNTMLRGTDNTYKSTKNNIHSVSQKLVIVPSLVDNAITVASYHTDKWDGTSPNDSVEYAPNISYRGLGHYEPSDFSMLSAQRYVITDGESAGSLSYINKPRNRWFE